MKSILVFLTVIAATLAWRNYAQEEHSWPKPLPSRPLYLPHFNKGASVQCGSFSTDVFKAGETYLILGPKNKFLSYTCASRCYIEASKTYPDQHCRFTVSILDNGKVALSISGSERQYIKLNGDRIVPTGNAIDESAQFAVEVISPGPGTGAHYIRLKADNEFYWGITGTHGRSDIVAKSSTNKLDTFMIVLKPF